MPQVSIRCGIPGDGIGPEVVAEGLKVLKATVGADAFDFTHYDLGASAGSAPARCCPIRCWPSWPAPMR
ncbi:MAG: hypothetical protein R2703_05885 [Micropruina glycogenica]